MDVETIQCVMIGGPLHNRVRSFSLPLSELVWDETGFGVYRREVAYRLRQQLIGSDQQPRFVYVYDPVKEDDLIALLKQPDVVRVVLATRQLDTESEHPVSVTEVPVNDFRTVLDALRELHDFAGLTNNYRNKDRCQAAFENAAKILAKYGA